MFYEYIYIDLLSNHWLETVINVSSIIRAIVILRYYISYHILNGEVSWLNYNIVQGTERSKQLKSKTRWWSIYIFDFQRNMLNRSLTLLTVKLFRLLRWQAIRIDWLYSPSTVQIETVRICLNYFLPHGNSSCRHMFLRIVL